jgi:hypothetical protein
MGISGLAGSILNKGKYTDDQLFDREFAAAELQDELNRAGATTSYGDDYYNAALDASGYDYSAGNMNGLSDWFKDNQSMINAGLGVGGLALGLANYGTMKDWYGKQGQLIDQQIANNAWNMQNKKDIQSAFKTV